MNRENRACFPDHEFSHVEFPFDCSCVFFCRFGGIRVHHRDHRRVVSNYLVCQFQHSSECFRKGPDLIDDSDHSVLDFKDRFYGQK